MIARSRSSRAVADQLQAEAGDLAAEAHELEMQRHLVAELGRHLGHLLQMVRRREQGLQVGDRPVMLERMQRGVVPGVLEQRLLRRRQLVDEALVGDPRRPRAQRVVQRVQRELGHHHDDHALARAPPARGTGSRAPPGAATTETSFFRIASSCASASAQRAAVVEVGQRDQAARPSDRQAPAAARAR